MVFNSLVFLFFFTSFYLLYWFVFNKNFKQQNMILLIGSYFFYGWADWRFLSFLILISVFYYLLGIYLEKSIKYKKHLLYFGLIFGIGILGFFKYYNFFISSFNDLFNSFNLNLSLKTLRIIVPLGISFLTFRLISYIIDVSNQKINSTKDWIVFFNYVSFFPSLLSGPIDKASLLVPQLEIKREFVYSKSVDGLRQILWGLFKKVVIADYLATLTYQIFDNYSSLEGSTLLLGLFLYTFQIYADFSGYSDMAIGLARLLGLTTTKNFAFPLFSQNIADFWRKWHISLTSWLTEYVFTPLSIYFRNYGKIGLILAIVINFTIIGFWHGPSWTYVLFGFLHGCFFIPLILNGTINKRKALSKDNLLPTLRELKNILSTFTLVTFSFVLFISNSLANAYSYLLKIFSLSFFSKPEISFVKVIPLILFFLSVEWIGRNGEHALSNLINLKSRLLRWVFYILIALSLFISQGKQQSFIYFQF